MCVYLFLQLAELAGHGLQADACLLELLVGRPHQVAAPIRRLARVLQLTGRHTHHREGAIHHREGATHHRKGATHHRKGATHHREWAHSPLAKQGYIDGTL